VLARSADRPTKILDITRGAGKPTRVDTSAYRAVQIYAYPYNPGTVPDPTTDVLTISVPLPAGGSTTAPAGSMALAAWASGTSAPKHPGPARELTRNVPQPALEFTVSDGGHMSLGDYVWRIVVYGWR
jgi:hypothetical protein